MWERCIINYKRCRKLPTKQRTKYNWLDMPGEVCCNLFGQALHHPSLWKAEKQQRLHLKSLKWQMSLLNCPADKGTLSLDNPTKWLAERATELFVTCQNTCYKWEMVLTGFEEWHREREILCVHRDGIVSVLRQHGRLSWHAGAYLESSESSLAVQSEGKPFRKALKFSRGLGGTLQKPLCV